VRWTPSHESRVGGKRTRVGTETGTNFGGGFVPETPPLATPLYSPIIHLEAYSYSDIFKSPIEELECLYCWLLVI